VYYSRNTVEIQCSAISLWVVFGRQWCSKTPDFQPQMGTSRFQDM
jgi:hypothetical protein